MDAIYTFVRNKKRPGTEMYRKIVMSHEKVQDTSTEPPPEGRFVAYAAKWTSALHETENTSKQNTKKK